MTNYHMKKADSDWEITTARSLDETEAIRPIWKEMQRNEPFPAINADIDRYLSVIKAAGNDLQPYITLVKQNGCPAVMVIGRIGKHALKLELGYKALFSPKLRCLTVVYGGILGQPKGDLCSLLVGELLKGLQRGEAQIIHFNHIRVDCQLYQFARKTPGTFGRDHFSKIEPHWTMSVPENMNQFYQGRSKKHRGNLKRCMRKLEKQYTNRVKVTTYKQEKDLDEAINAVSRVSYTTYQNGLGCGFRDDSRTRILLTTAARLGWLRISVLYIEGKPSAFQIGLHYRKRYFLEQIGFDPKWSKFNVGTVLFLRVLEDICADPDIELIDFGFGDTQYKQSYSNRQWQEASVYIFAPKLYPIFINTLRTSIITLDAGLKYAVNRTGTLSWIKRRWRNLLRKKIPENSH